MVAVRGPHSRVGTTYQQHRSGYGQAGVLAKRSSIATVTNRPSLHGTKGYPGTRGFQRHKPGQLQASQNRRMRGAASSRGP